MATSVCKSSAKRARIIPVKVLDDYGYGTFGAGTGEAIRLDDAGVLEDGQVFGDG